MIKLAIIMIDEKNTKRNNNSLTIKYQILSIDKPIISRNSRSVLRNIVNNNTTLALSTNLNDFNSTQANITKVADTPTWKIKVVPTFSSEVTSMSPWRRLVIFLQVESPRPTPFGLRWALQGSVMKSRKRRPISYLGIPTPVSLTLT